MCGWAACARPATKPAASTTARKSAARIRCVFIVRSSMRRGVVDAGADFGDGIVDQGDSFAAVTALVGHGRIELRARAAQLVERRAHVRLAGAAGAAGQVPTEKAHDVQEGKNDSSFTHGAILSPLGCHKVVTTLLARAAAMSPLHGPT